MNHIAPYWYSETGTWYASEIRQTTLCHVSLVYQHKIQLLRLLFQLDPKDGPVHFVKTLEILEGWRCNSSERNAIEIVKLLNQLTRIKKVLFLFPTDDNHL